MKKLLLACLLGHLVVAIGFTDEPKNRDFDVMQDEAQGFDLLP